MKTMRGNKKRQRSEVEQKNDIKLSSSEKLLKLMDEKSPIDITSSTFRLICPVCKSHEYKNYYLLDGHMKKNHHDFKLNCDKCNDKTFKLYSVLILHNFMDHTNNDENYLKSNNNNMIDSSGSSGYGSSESQEEEKKEVEDVSVVKFREMKVRGEFPCRLCNKIFQNLRALKGHISAHLNVSPGMAYSCNVCSYTSFDEKILRCHLHSHNGARPFECSECNLTFTTKANCERHIRNRHRISTDDGVKRVLICHLSKKTKNENIDNTTTTKTTKTTISPKSVRINPSKVQIHCNYENDKQKSDDNLNINADTQLKYDSSKSTDKITINHFEASDSIMQRADAIDGMKNESNDHHDNYLNLNDTNINNNDDTPLDLSMKTVDLSIKKDDLSIKLNNNGLNLSIQDYYKRHCEAQQFSPTQALMYSGQDNIQQNSFYGNIGGYFPALQQPYVGGTSYIAPYLYYPYLYHPFSQDIIMRESTPINLVRVLQLTSGGSIIEPAIDNNANFSAAPLSSAIAVASPSVSYGQIPNSSARRSPSPISSCIGKLKLPNLRQTVIEDDLLLLKEKKRRSDVTEESNTCPLCSTSFTLRSNMNRHIRDKHYSYI